MTFKTTIICDNCQQELSPFERIDTDYTGKYIEDVKHYHHDCECPKEKD